MKFRSCTTIHSRKPGAELRQHGESPRLKKSKLQKVVNDLKEHLKKMSATEKQREKETTSPADNNQETANLLQQIVSTKAQIKKEVSKMEQKTSKNELLLKHIQEVRHALKEIQ